MAHVTSQEFENFKHFEDYQNLKLELADERSISRDKTVEQDTMLIKLQSEQAVLQEKLSSAKRELQSKVEQI